MTNAALWGIVALQAAVLLSLALFFFRRRSKDLQARLLAEQRYRTLFQNVQEGVFISTPAGRFLDFNEAFLRMMGYPSREALMGVDITSTCFVLPEDREYYKRLLRENGSVHNFEYQLRRHGGDVMTVSESSVAVRSSAGAVLCYQGFVRDVTERKRDQERLLQREKLAAIGQMIAGVAHELNNPLTAILGYSQLLADGPHVTPRGAEFVAKIYKQTGRTHRIVQNLLRFASQRQPERALLNLPEILDDTLALREYDLKLNNITVHRDGDAPLPAPLGDAHQIQQVFLNILTNAMDAILQHARGGEIWVRTGALDGAVEVTFTDSGRGVENPLRVFDPFYTTKAVGQGTGLGLSICYGIVRDHGGEITVRNSPPRGATFSVLLPAAAGDSPQPARPMGVETFSDSESLGRVLLVDDEEAVLDLEEEILRPLADFILVARSGREAIAVLETHPVDLLVTDLKMPGDVSGHDLYDWLVLHRPELAHRVVFTMSDSGHSEARKLAEDSGCPCVQKPFQVETLRAAVRQAAAGEPLAHIL